MNDNWDLKGKKALITGGTKGIGLAICQLFLEKDAEVFIVSRTKAALESLIKKHNNLYGVSIDVSQKDAPEKIIKALPDQWQSLDILVNNVGTNIRKATAGYSEDEYSFLMQTNLDSCFRLTKTSYPLLKKSGHASVVNISSVAGINHIKTGSIYGMTKAAINQLSKNLAVEWAKDGIRVNAVAPWYINTPLAQTAFTKPGYLDAVLERTPLGRIGEPKEVAALVAFLCMDIAGFITGQCIAADGGFSVNSFN
ncbi:MAG: SDR family oxidoreductase [Flammeovirgaceae bacterium]|nr:SDR family oxidoreductase [Flammeovirgaceae bacterium]